MTKMISIAKVAEMIALHKRTALEMLRESKVPVYRVGRRKLAVHEEDVFNWLKQRQVKEEEKNDK